MHEYLKGAALSIWLVEGAQLSWDEAEAQVPKNQSSCAVQFRARMAHLAATGRLRSPDHMNHEDKGIYAIKATCGLRAYGWHDNHQGGRAFIISHVRLKKTQKLDPADRDRALKAKRLFEEARKASEKLLRSVK